MARFVFRIRLIYPLRKIIDRRITIEADIPAAVSLGRIEHNDFLVIAYRGQDPAPVQPVSIGFHPGPLASLEAQGQ